MHSFRSAALGVSETKDGSERTADHVDIGAREAGPDVIKLRPQGEMLVQAQIHSAADAAHASRLLKQDRCCHQNHFSHCSLLRIFPEFSSGERKLRSAGEKLKRQGTPRGRKRGMSHDVAALRLGRVERKGLTGQKVERGGRDAIRGSGQAGATALRKPCGERRKRYFTSQVSPARRSLARSPGPRLAMTAWTCSFMTSS